LNPPESSCPGDKEWKQMELRNDPLYEVFEAKYQLRNLTYEGISLQIRVFLFCLFLFLYNHVD